MNQHPELLSLSDIAFTYDLEQYKDSLEVYFLKHWTIGRFYAQRKGAVISQNSLRFLIVFVDGLSWAALNQMSDPRIVLSFRKRASDNIGFVLVDVDKKGW